MTDNIYRTLRQTEQLRDYSNYSLRFNRSLREAGWPTRQPDPRPARYFWITYLALIGALLLVLL